MTGVIESLFPGKKLRDTVAYLQKENRELRQKLFEKQEQINRTNAYWKKKFYTRR